MISTNARNSIFDNSVQIILQKHHAAHRENLQRINILINLIADFIPDEIITIRCYAG